MLFFKKLNLITFFRQVSSEWTARADKQSFGGSNRRLHRLDAQRDQQPHGQLRELAVDPGLGSGHLPRHEPYSVLHKLRQRPVGLFERLCVQASQKVSVPERTDHEGAREDAQGPRGGHHEGQQGQPVHQGDAPRGPRREGPVRDDRQVPGHGRERVEIGRLVRLCVRSG